MNERQNREKIPKRYINNENRRFPQRLRTRKGGEIADALFSKISEEIARLRPRAFPRICLRSTFGFGVGYFLVLKKKKEGGICRVKLQLRT